MKVLICGSRGWENMARIRQRLVDLVVDDEGRVSAHNVTVVTGGARGVDSCAHYFARAIGCKTKVMKADWQQHGKAAGPTRNRQMLDEQPDLVIAFWDGVSKGTLDTINEAKRRGIRVEVMTADERDQC